MWLVYVAGDAAIEKLSGPLTPDAELAARKLPTATGMIEELGKKVGQGVPAPAHQMLVQFKDMSWHAMNSFVHGGIHPLRRSTQGFPLHLVLRTRPAAPILPLALILGESETMFASGLARWLVLPSALSSGSCASPRRRAAG